MVLPIARLVIRCSQLQTGAMIMLIILAVNFPSPLYVRTRPKAPFSLLSATVFASLTLELLIPFRIVILLFACVSWKQSHNGNFVIDSRK